MFTENWPLQHDPEWPARRIAGDQQPRVVYLDQWCFDHLARDRAGAPKDQSEAGSYKILREMALDGSVIFALSQVHYRENWKRTNADARWDTAIVMGELSGFHTLSTKGLEYWDATVAGISFLALPYTVDRPDPLGWGVKHCLSGREAQAYILDTATGAPARWDESLPEAVRAELDRVASVLPHRLELAVLALRDQRMEPMFPPLVAIPDTKTSAFVAAETSIRAEIDRKGRSAKAVRNLVELLTFRDSLRFFDPLLQTLSLDPNTIVNAVANDIVDGQSPSMQGLLAAMPMQGIFTELRVQAHLQADRKVKESDVLDYLALATALPFVDYFVTDKPTFHLASAAKLDLRGGGKVLRSLRVLCDELQGLT